MNRFSLTHLSNEVLGKELSSKAANEKKATADLLAHIAEFDERKLYLPAAYESMLAYCKGELNLSEDAAKKRIQVARAGREYPGVFEALEEGRVHLTGLRLLAPHLSPETAVELLDAATQKSKEDIERLLAERSPRLDVPAHVTSSCVEGAPGHPARPRCEAERHQTFGAGFMGQKRAEATAARAAAKAAKEQAKAQKAAEREASRLQPHQLEVLPWLEQLGCSKQQSRIAVERCRDMADAPLEDRVKRALSWFGERIGRKVLSVAASAGNTVAPAQVPA